MNLKAVALILAQVLTPIAAYAGLGCDAHSGPNTAALVELYTSEGCSSCPPADRVLSRLGDTLSPSAAAIPLALHVGYWNYLGWTDLFAQDRFAQRQEWLVHANAHRTVYTPQFFVAGTEMQPGQTSLPDAVRRLNAKPATAAIRLHTSLAADNLLTVDAVATTHAGDDTAALYLAIAESGLLTRVMAGENQGTTLAHDHVVREWFGPFRLHGGAAQIRRELRLPAAWQRERLEMIAFVQDERTGTVRQALRATACPGS